MTVNKTFFTEDIRLRFRSFINNRSGLYFKDHDLKDLENSVVSRMGSLGLDSPALYYHYITESEERENEFRELLNLLTINHTYFFRNESQFKALKVKVLPEIIEHKMKENGERRQLRIWSAGCSTGEEPYTIAMIVRDIIPDAEDWDIYILATDASTDSLEKARKGAYTANSVKLVDKEYLEKYFQKNVSGKSSIYTVNDAIKNMVTFAFHNLTEDSFPQGFDIIFCRNVVIYFDLATTIKIMHKFHSSLSDNGYLFIGYSENLQFMRDEFRMVDWQEAIYYRKGPGEEVKLTMAVQNAEENIDFDKIIEELSRSEIRADAASSIKKDISPRKIQEILVEIVKSIHLKNYSDALCFVNEAIGINKNNTEPYYLAAEICMNQGKFEDAKSWLSSAVKIDPLFSAAHYLFGCIYIEEEKLDEAKVSFRRALYLDKDFSLAHFYLANIHKEEGSISSAIREYRNTLNGLSKSRLNDILAYSGGFNAATLASVCRDNLERLKAGQ